MSLVPTSVSTASNQIGQSITIGSVVLHRVRVPFVEPFRISNGEVSEKESILIELTTNDGLVGWGETSPMSGSFYSADTPDSSWNALRDHLLPELLSIGTLEPSVLHEFLNEQPVDAFTKAGVEGAVWDIFAKLQQMPLHTALGVQKRAIPSGVAIGIFDTVEQLIERVRRYVNEGYQRVKIKIQPGWDIEPVAAVRSQFPNVPLMVDANAAYSVSDADIFKELDRFELMMIEQPLATDAMQEAGVLQAELRTPLCADESADSLASLNGLIQNKAARIINIKVQRVGGLSAALLMLEAARAAGLTCWVGTMPELGIASAQGLHLAMHSGFSFPSDIEESSRWFADDVIEPLIEIDRDGFIHVPDGVGTGFKVSREKVERYTTAVEEFTF